MNINWTLKDDEFHHLWADDRKLSEAGVRRFSNDSSNTYNAYDSTDNYIIGDRVYIGGNIPGKIAYIGETKFGPGDWVGIVLDEATGKNDGTVGGIRYFQCEPKHGIFSRLNKITRTPYLNLTDRSSSIDDGRYSPFKKSSLDENPYKKLSFDGLFSRKSSDGGLGNISKLSLHENIGNYDLFSRKSSIDSGRKSSIDSGRKNSIDSGNYSRKKSLGNNTYDIPINYSGRESPSRHSSGFNYGSSPQYNYGHNNQNQHYGYGHEQTRKLSGKTNDLKIGDRVIISSSQGSKSGVLKYKGDTYFADGEWCGVELDDPLGKNDGSVQGVRYFYCEPKFGVFAPLNKISKSPVSATKVSKNCMVHPNHDIPIVSTIVKQVKPQPGSRPFMDKTTTIVYTKNPPKGAKAVQQIHQIKSYNHSWDADCY